MLRKSKFFLIVTTLSLLSILGASVVFAAPAPKVDVCHLTDTGAYVKINVSENALPAHVEHGDASPGELVPGVPGKKFADDCTLVDANANVAGTWCGQSGYEGVMGYLFTMTLSQDSNGAVTGQINYDNGALRSVSGQVTGNLFTFITSGGSYWADCKDCTVTVDGNSFHGYGKHSINFGVIEWDASRTCD